MNDYFLSPDRDKSALRSWLSNNDLSFEDGVILGSSYKDAEGSESIKSGNLYTHYEIESGGLQDEMDDAGYDNGNGTNYVSTGEYSWQIGADNMLPFGTRYETKLCCTLHIPLESVNMPDGSGVGAVDDVEIHGFFNGDGWTLVDLTENPEFEESILAKLGYCNDSAYGDLTGGGG